MPRHWEGLCRQFYYSTSRSTSESDFGACHTHTRYTLCVLGFSSPSSLCGIYNVIAKRASAGSAKLFLQETSLYPDGHKFPGWLAFTFLFNNCFIRVGRRRSEWVWKMMHLRFTEMWAKDTKNAANKWLQTLKTFVLV